MRNRTKRRFPRNRTATTPVFGLVGGKRVTLLLSPAPTSSHQMTQSSEDRLPDQAASPAQKSAQILPFERPRSELQRAVQLRAQEALDLDRDRTRAARKVSPLRAIVIFALAAIPVYLMVSAFDSFVRVLHRVYATLDEQPAPAAPPLQAPVQQQPVSTDPGVVILVNPTDGRATGSAAPGTTPTPEAQSSGTTGR